MENGLRERIAEARNSDAFPELLTRANAYGVIHFQHFKPGTADKLPPFVKISFDTEPRELWTILKTFWKLPKPSYLLTISDSTFSSSDNDWHVRSTLREIVKTCYNTGAWIVTDGLSAGLAKLIGTEVKSLRSCLDSYGRSKLVLLGLCPWHAIRDRKVLVNDECTGSFPAFYNCGSLPGQDKERSSSLPLDENHSHFVLVDETREKKSGVASRTVLERFLQSCVVAGLEWNEMELPILKAVIGGKYKHLRSSMQAIRADIPIIAFEKSGGAAELIAQAYELSNGASKWEKKSTQEWSKRMTPIMQRTVHDVSNRSKEYLLKIISKRHLVTVVKDERGGQESALSYKVLLAIKCGTAAGVVDLLKLATSWNQYNFAEAEILATNFKSVMPGVELNELLTESLVSNKHQLAKLYLEHGCDVRGFLTRKTLETLYTKVLAEKDNNTLKMLFETLVYKRRPRVTQGSSLLRAVGALLTKLVGKWYPNEYADDADSGSSSSRAPADDETMEKSSEKHLLIWATLFARPELASYFWKTGTNHIATSIVAYKIASKMSACASEEHLDILSGKYESLAALFERSAISALQCCYDRDSQLTWLCLTRTIESLGGYTVISMADMTQHPIIGHPSCQHYIAEIWRGGIAERTQYWKMVLVALLPLIFVGILKFDTCDLNRLLEYQSKDETFSWRSFRSSSKISESVTSEVKNEKNSRINKGDQWVDSQHVAKIVTLRNRHVTLTGNEDYAISYAAALSKFLTAPVTKFIYSTISHMTFVIIFAIFLLTELSAVENVGDLGILEILTWVWCLSMTVEEMRQVITGKGIYLRIKYEEWWSDIWNRLDAAQNFLFILAVVFRFFLPIKHFMYARMAYAISMTLFVVRSIQLLFVFKDIGIKMVLIGRMFWDLVFFTIFLSVLLACFGVTYSSLLFPEADLDADLLSKVIYDPYRMILGQLALEDLGPSNHSVCYSEELESNVSSLRDCRILSQQTGRNYALYYLLVNVLVIELLMALFRAQSIQQRTPKRMWQNSRYSLVYEVAAKPLLPCPLNLLSMAFQLLKKIRWSLTAHDGSIGKRAMEVCLDDEGTKRVLTFEEDAVKISCAKSTEVSQFASNAKSSKRPESCASNDEGPLAGQLNAMKDALNRRLAHINSQNQTLQLQLTEVLERLKCRSQISSKGDSHGSGPEPLVQQPSADSLSSS